MLRHVGVGQVNTIIAMTTVINAALAGNFFDMMAMIRGLKAYPCAGLMRPAARLYGRCTQRSIEVVTPASMGNGPRRRYDVGGIAIIAT
jgi:hypothetical protein